MSEGNTETVSKADFDALRAKADAAIMKEVNLQKELEKFTSLGGLEDLKAKLLDADKLKREQAKTPEQIQALMDEAVKTARADAQKEIEKRDGELTTTKSKLKELTVVDTVFGVMSTAITDTAKDDAKREIREACDIDENGTVIIKGADGKPRFKADKPTELMTPEDFKAELIVKKPHLFKALVKPGGAEGGETKPGSGSSGLTLEKWKSLTRDQQLQYPGEVRAEMGAQVLSKGKV